jgi:hypothetical protein
MACSECTGGVWICDDGPDPPDCEFDLIPFASIYVGRFHIAAGTTNVWARGNNVSISDNQPLQGTGAAWTQFGDVTLPATDDYDVWIKPGGSNKTKIKIQA